jgi:hypothetical protein
MAPQNSEQDCPNLIAKTPRLLSNPGNSDAQGFAVDEPLLTDRRMEAQKFIKCACTHCGGHIEFPAEALGMAVPCPHCSKKTSLLPNLAPPPSESAPPPPAPPTMDEEPAGPAQATVKCPACGFESDRPFRKCPVCDAPYRRSGGWNWKTPAVAATALVAVGAGLFVGYRLFWNKGPSLPPGTGPVVLDYAIERVADSSLIYVVGTVSNNSARDFFGLHVNFELLDKDGGSTGTATDYLDIIGPNRVWNFRALVLDTNTTSAKLVGLEMDKQE